MYSNMYVDECTGSSCNRHVVGIPPFTVHGGVVALFSLSRGRRGAGWDGMHAGGLGP